MDSLGGSDMLVIDHVSLLLFMHDFGAKEMEVSLYFMHLLMVNILESKLELCSWGVV